MSQLGSVELLAATALKLKQLGTPKEASVMIVLLPLVKSASGGTATKESTSVVFVDTRVTATPTEEDPILYLYGPIALAVPVAVIVPLTCAGLILLLISVFLFVCVVFA